MSDLKTLRISGAQAITLYQRAAQNLISMDDVNAITALNKTDLSPEEHKKATDTLHRLLGEEKKAKAQKTVSNKKAVACATSYAAQFTGRKPGSPEVETFVNSEPVQKAVSDFMSALIAAWNNTVSPKSE
jgi:hypothetical protein